VWITSIVNLHESLVHAQEEGTLVIFAGAGVSTGPPSNLPDFTHLAIEIAAEVWSPEQAEPLDRFLGRLRDLGVNVHQKARAILSNPASSPTRLHWGLVSLFDSPDAIRIVTTNIDRHFSAIAAELHGEAVEKYYAPALPLGREFAGLVYMHGNVEKDAARLVLTDVDFGEAYLTDGWATRFLRDMFASYTVLFVGYSHNDPIIRYLARGLPPATARYALTLPGQEEHWKSLGVIPTMYPPTDGPDRHAALCEAISAWVEYSKKGILDHERRIREIVESTPPLDPAESDYIDHCLQELPTVRFFTRHARAPHWLRWAEDKDACLPLFQTCVQADDISREMATWFARYFASQHPQEALALVQRQGQRLGRVLWQTIALELYRTSRPEAETLARWVAVLLSCKCPHWSSESLNYILSDCRYPEDSSTMLILFEHLTRPRIVLTGSFSLGSEDGGGPELVDPSIVIEGNEYWLGKCWSNIFLPNLGGLAPRLEPILTSHLTQANLLLRTFGKANDRRDLSSLLRSAIEPHQQDHHKDAVDILVDAARDLIEWMANNEPQRAQALIEEWASCGVPLLRRLAIHGMTESPALAPDEKIAWIVAKDWLYLSGAKHEVFRLIERAYPCAGEVARTRLVESADRGLRGEAAAGLAETTRQYEVYNLLVWLHRVAPDCPMAHQQLDAIQAAHPEFRPREHPDLEVVTSVGWAQPPSPLSVAQLLEKQGPAAVDWLVTCEAEQPEDRLTVATEAAVQDFEWSWRLAAALPDGKMPTCDIWCALLQGWQRSSLTETQLTKVLSVLREHPHLCRLALPTASLLEKAASEAHISSPLSWLSLAEALAEQLWDVCAELPSDDEASAYGSWLAAAINHPGGVISEFWLHGLSRRLAKGQRTERTLPADYKRYFTRILSGESYWAQMGRVVLASQLHFLFTADPDWTKESILPLLDWSRDERRAEQAWHGYLTWGRWNDALLPGLVPLYEQSFGRLSQALSGMRDRFCEHLADIAIYGSVDPLGDGWLRRFISETDAQSRASWANRMASGLRGVKRESVRQLWHDWIDFYWSQRTTGIPLPLALEETEAMLAWAIPLEPVFPLVVERICSTPAPALEHTRLYHQLLEQGLASSYPAALARLLRHLLPSAAEPFHHLCADVEHLVRQLAGSTADRGDLVAVCNQLARLGCPSAADIERLVADSSD